MSDPEPRDDPPPPQPPPMSDPPTPEELDAKRRWDVDFLMQLAAQAEGAAQAPQARRIDGFHR